MGLISQFGFELMQCAKALVQSYIPCQQVDFRINNITVGLRLNVRKTLVHADCHIERHQLSCGHIGTTSPIREPVFSHTLNGYRATGCCFIITPILFLVTQTHC